MEIRRLTEKDIPELYRFGKVMFPSRSSFYHKIIDFMQKDRMGGYTGGMGLFDGDELCGQILYSATTLWYNGTKYPTGWNYDLIIREDLRKDAWGIDLLMKSWKEFPLACATGSGPNAEKINLKLGSKHLGQIRKYIGLSSKWRIIQNLIFPLGTYPESINGFKLIHTFENFKARDYFNNNLIEPGRDPNYIKWRFFTPNFKDYKVYQDDEGDFFVIRVIKIKGFSILSLLDFRCTLDRAKSFDRIFKSVKNIANHIRVPFILCGSSHKDVDQVLEKDGFKSMGRPRPVLTTGRNKVRPDAERVNNRNYILITLADSDGEISW